MITLAVDRKDPEIIVSIVGILVAMIALFLAVHFVQIETRSGTVCIIVGYYQKSLSSNLPNIDRVPMLVL